MSVIFNGHTYPTTSVTYVDGVMTGYGYTTQWYSLLNDAASDFAASVAAASVQAVSATNSASAASGSASAAAASAVLSSAQATALVATASNTLTIGSGSRAFTIGTGKTFAVNQWLVAFADANDYVLGQVSSYTGGVLTLTVPSNGFFGSGTFSSWTLGPSGAPGPTGSAGSGRALTYQNVSFLSAVNRAYACDTSGGALTATLPASPVLGDNINFVDCRDSFATNNLTLVLNGKTLVVTTAQGANTVSTNFILNLNSIDLTIWFDGSQWRTL